MRTNGADIKPYYRLDEWEIIEEEFRPERNYQSETIFAVGNGYIGMRGTFEEGLGDNPAGGFEGTFLNGVYEEGTIHYGEAAYGFPEISQTMVNAANGKVILLYLDSEEFNMRSGKLLEYRRSLNMKEGILRRSLVWQSPGGKQIRLETERMASFQRTKLAALRYSVTPLNFDGSITLVSEIDGSTKPSTIEKDPRVGCAPEDGVFYTVDAVAEEDMTALVQKTKKTGITVACVTGGVMKTGCSFGRGKYTEGDSVGLEYSIEAAKGKAIEYTKYIIYNASPGESGGVLEQALRTLKEAVSEGYERLKSEQRSFLADYWYKSDVRINGDIALQQAIRFNLFHLLQSAGRDGKTNICAKGLTGEGYEGHYFWDTEMYILPTFLYSHPEVSRKLLEYRYNTLDKARERARQMAHSRGALFPWRTINGAECSAFFPASTAQYHINGDIAYAIKEYVDSTQDTDFLVSCGAEILIETARLWAGLGFFNRRKGGRFCINCVTGPDEYTAIVNNNCYTNLIAQENFEYAHHVIAWMKQAHEDSFIELAARTGLEEEELALWKKAADNMYIPYDDELEIHPQDDSFLDKAVWDLEGTPGEKYPLLLHFHPLVIYRHQVCKQADMVLALFLLSERFTEEQKKRDYDYYERVTTHDSSLSACIFSIVASDIGYHKKAYDYFIKTVRTDLDDLHGNTKHGVHTANMAGSWMCVVYGFAGMRAKDGLVGFSPYVPDGWLSYAFKVLYRNNLISIEVDDKGTLYELIGGSTREIMHKGKVIRLECGKPVRMV